MTHDGAASAEDVQHACAEKNKIFRKTPKMY